MLYRLCKSTDVLPMARIRAREWGGVEYWTGRISGYLQGRINPQHALAPRTCYVAAEHGSVVGFVTGHLTARHGCDGELEWINVIPERRRGGVASQLLRLLARWFFQQGAFRVCVDVNPANAEALAFYMRNGAERLHENWLVWNDIRVVMGMQRERARRSRDGRTGEASRYGKLSQRAFEKIMQRLEESLASPLQARK